MALAVAHNGGNVGTQSGSLTSDTWTSTPGSDIIVCGFLFNSSAAAVNGDVTDVKGNTYTLLKSLYGGSSAVGLGFWHNNNGTRGASHTVTFHPGTGNPDVNLGVCEITGQLVASDDYDATTGATAHDVTSPLTVTPAAAITGNQIAFYAAIADYGTNTAWGQPAGYTDVTNQPDGGSFLPCMMSRKIGATGTTAVAATNAATIADARELLVTFKQLGWTPPAATPKPAPGIAPVSVILL